MPLNKQFVMEIAIHAALAMSKRSNKHKKKDISVSMETSQSLNQSVRAQLNKNKKLLLARTQSHKPVLLLIKLQDQVLHPKMELSVLP